MFLVMNLDLIFLEFKERREDKVRCKNKIFVIDIKIFNILILWINDEIISCKL